MNKENKKRGSRGEDSPSVVVINGVIVKEQDFELGIGPD